MQLTIMSHNMSLYIPVVFKHVSTPTIVSTFAKLDIGKVTKVDRIPVMSEEQGVAKHKHDQVFVHLQWCTESIAAMNLYDTLAGLEGATAKLVYDEPYYWALYKNKNPEQSVIREQGMRIQGLEAQINALLRNQNMLVTRVNELEKRDWQGLDGWQEALASDQWKMDGHPRGVSGIESLEPWEDNTPDPFHHDSSPITITSPDDATPGAFHHNSSPITSPENTTPDPFHHSEG